MVPTAVSSPQDGSNSDQQTGGSDEAGEDCGNVLFRPRFFHRAVGVVVGSFTRLPAFACDLPVRCATRLHALINVSWTRSSLRSVFWRSLEAQHS
jgi:hypothetical protein